MEILEITRLLVKISDKLWDHKCVYKFRNDETCKDCMLAIDVDYVIFNLRGKKK